MNMMIIKALVLLLVSAAIVSVCEGFITHTNHTKSSFHTTTLHLIQNDDIEPNMREPLTKHSGEYLVEFAIGTPPLKVFANMDTGSTLTWIQCDPCKHCYPQSTPKFNRKASSTFEIVPYSAPECFSDGLYESEGIHGRCNYSVEYGDKATSDGFIAKDKMRIGSLTIPEFTMGCGVENRGKFSPRASGIIGLGNTRDSLIGQLGQLIHNKFSYCLSERLGYLSLGEADDDIFSESVSTALVSPHYYVTLNAIQIGKIRVPFTDSSKIKKGNLIIDSGTPLIYLPRKLYERVREEISKQVKSERVDNVKKYTLMLRCTRVRGS